MTLFESQWQTVRACWDGKRFHDIEKLQGALSEITDKTLADSRCLQEAVELLASCSHNYGEEFDTQLEFTLNQRERVLLNACQEAEERRKELEEKVLPKRHLWIEKLIMVIDIQRLQSDPRQQARDQLEKLRLQLRQMHQDIARLEQSIGQRVTALKE